MIARWLVILVALATVVAACTLLEDDVPDARTCERREDCFEAERCDLAQKLCIPIDAGAP